MAEPIIHEFAGAFTRPTYRRFLVLLLANSPNEEAEPEVLRVSVDHGWVFGDQNGKRGSPSGWSSNAPSAP